MTNDIAHDYIKYSMWEYKKHLLKNRLQYVKPQQASSFNLKQFANDAVELLMLNENHVGCLICTTCLVDIHVLA